MYPSLPPFVVEYIRKGDYTCARCNNAADLAGVQGLGVRRPDNHEQEFLFVDYVCPSCANRSLNMLMPMTLDQLALQLLTAPENESDAAKLIADLDTPRPSIGERCPDEPISNGEATQFIQRMRYTCFRRDSPGWAGFMKRMEQGCD